MLSSTPAVICEEISIEHIPGMAGAQGIARAFGVGEDEIQPDARNEFETRDAGAGELARDRQKPQRLGGIGEADEGRRDRARIGKQFQRRGGDDPERAFRADEQVLEIVAGIVLAQLARDR